VCDSGEPTATSDAEGGFVLNAPVNSAIVAEIPAASSSSAVPGGDRLVFRAAAEAATGGAIVVSPLSTEVVRMMEADGIAYEAARQQLADRLSLSTSDVSADPNAVPAGAARTAWLTESAILSRRFALAARMVDRRDVSPAQLARNARATGPVITMREAQQAAMNLEGIPRYDHIFIVVLENKPTERIKNSRYAPKINEYLTSGNEFTSYYATGNPSLPNRLALSSADDFGVTDDNPWNCVPEGDTVDLPDDPLPAGAPCVNPTNHNLKHRANLFTAMTQAGLTWRMYSESMTPGGDWRLNSPANDAITAPDHVYPADSPVGAIGDRDLWLTLPASLYATKHNGTTMFQEVRSSPEFLKNNRTMGGGQWDDALKKSGLAPAGWDFDQLGTDLRTGDIGHLNFLEPDQCDDMHGIKVSGTAAGTTMEGLASDCAGEPGIYRGDRYVEALVTKIQTSPVWTNQARRVAIVLMFDEASAVTGFNSCCGWNPSAGPLVAGRSLGVLSKAADGTISVETTIANYSSGNRGHGASVFGVLTNQPKAPKGVVDSDAYSHASLVRTLQDMFQLADPGDDWSYMNRSKYTERFIAAHLALLPEYANSADPHFDAVRPMNHAYVIPKGYVQKNGFPTAQIGPDRDQRNPWALK
jgi:hypothetical protein